MSVAEIVKRMVESRGISYTFISERTGIPVNSISRSFLGKRRFPADEMILICNAIGVELNEINAFSDPGSEDVNQYHGKNGN